MIHKWPDGTPKSMHNAFNWRDNALGVLSVKFAAPIPARAKDLNSNGNIYSYTKATNITKFPATTRSGKLHTINKETP